MPIHTTLHTPEARAARRWLAKRAPSFSVLQHFPTLDLEPKAQSLAF